MSITFPPPVGDWGKVTITMRAADGTLLWASDGTNQAPADDTTIEFSPAAKSLFEINPVPGDDYVIKAPHSLHIDHAWRAVMERVDKELEHHENKWGVQYHTLADWFMITSEEYGEAFKAANEGNLYEVQDEIVDTIACLVQTYEECRRLIEGETSGPYTPVNHLYEGDSE